MPLSDYVVRRDHFRFRESIRHGLSFPCVVCDHRNTLSTQFPCNVCDHNANAQPETPAEVCKWSAPYWFGGNLVHSMECRPGGSIIVGASQITCPMCGKPVKYESV
jgi:hypothetical protein